ncbi:hypothetical protein Ocin01_13581 [Orchesella cincta]|uniref:Uncharacterized protein n=1 Tax=Orchesella cincta TaxID=48709 RepID=A0A1D2MJW7_ORCCI|nr:hypothetical protein Ocin01_13581 [Orchesella cincta]
MADSSGTPPESPRRTNPSGSIGLIDDSRLSLAASRVVAKAIQHVATNNDREAVNNSERNSVKQNAEDDTRQPEEAIVAEEVDGWKDRSKTEDYQENVLFGVVEGNDFSDNQNDAFENMAPNEQQVGVPVAGAMINVLELEGSRVSEIQEDNNASPGMFAALLVPYSGDLRESVGSISEASSMQVLVPVHPIPEESEAKIDATKDLIEQHVIPIESTLPGGFEIHRNNSNSHIQIIRTKPAVGNELPKPTSSTFSIPQSGNNETGQVAEMKYIQGYNATRTIGDNEQDQFNNVIDEMAAAVAAEALSLPSLSFIEELTIQFSSVTAAAGIPLFSLPSQPDGGNRFQSSPQSNNMATLPLK